MAATNLGWVKPVHKGTTAPTNTDMLWKDTNVSPVVMKEYDSTTLTWLALGNGVYTNANLTPVTVGGYAAGSTFSNKTNQQMWDGLLYPEQFGTLTDPSSTFTSSVTGLRKVGETISSIVFSSAFGRGSINPQYQSANGYRSGLPNTYVYTGSGLSDFPSTSLTDSKTVTSHVVILGAQSWTGAVAYDIGVQPKGSDGTEFDNELPAGTTSVKTCSITGVYPFFATTSSISTLTEAALQVHGTDVTTSMVSEDNVDKQAFDIPVAWGASGATSLLQYNPTFDTWTSISLSTFTKTSISKTINSNSVSYFHYVHNGVTIGARILKWGFA